MNENKEYSIACKEVLEILKYIKKDELNRIPNKEIEILKKNASSDYEFIYNPKIGIKEQNVSKMAKAIIANYFVNYIATDEEKKVVKDKQAYDMKMVQENLKIYVDTDEIFKNKSKDENKNLESELPIEIKKDTFFMKLSNFIKKIFKVH